MFKLNATTGEAPTTDTLLVDAANKTTVPSSQQQDLTTAIDQMANQASNISIQDPNPPVRDILSRFPLEITYHVFEHLSDKDKIKASGVCKSWEAIAKIWHEEHRQSLCKKFAPPSFDPALFNWTVFKDAARHAHFYPSSTPSGIISHDSASVDFINSKDYIAWVDGTNVVTARLRKPDAVKPGESRVEGEVSHKLSTLLEFSKFPLFVEILSVDDSGIVVVAVGSYLNVPDLTNGPKAEQHDKVIVAFFAFDIEKDEIVWMTDRDGNAIKPGEITEEKVFDTYFVVNYATQSTLFNNGLLIKATSEIKNRTFAVWHMDISSGKQHLVANDFAKLPERPAEDMYPERFEPRHEEVADIKPDGYRRNYRANQFDIKLLPFRNQQGEQEYAVITWSHDWTYPMFNPLRFIDPATGLPFDFQSGRLSSRMQQLVDLGLDLNPVGWNLDPFVRNRDILEDPANEHLSSGFPESFVGSINLGTEDIAIGDHPHHQFHAELVIINIKTGEILDNNLRLPAFHAPTLLPYDEYVKGKGTVGKDTVGKDTVGEDSDDGDSDDDGFDDETIDPETDTRMADAVRVWADWHARGTECKPEEIWSQEIGDILNGQNGTQVRYPVGMQIYTQDVLTDPTPHSQLKTKTESIALGVVLYTGVQRNITFLIPSHSPYKTPEAWNILVTRTLNNDGTSSFAFSNLLSTLYPVIFRRIVPAPPKLVVNPLQDIVLDNADVPCLETDELALWDEELTPEEWEENNADILADIPNTVDCVAEITEFEEVQPKRRLMKDGENVWVQRWMKAKEKRGIYAPKDGKAVDIDDKDKKRIGWKSKWGMILRADQDPQPMEIGENGIKFGGLWVWN